MVRRPRLTVELSFFVCLLRKPLKPLLLSLEATLLDLPRFLLPDTLDKPCHDLVYILGAFSRL